MSQSQKPPVTASLGVTARLARLALIARRAGIACLGSLALAVPAFAAPPPNSDMTYAPWFHSLRQPGTGMSCCSIADCRETDFRTNGDHYEALIQSQWVRVPNDKVLPRADNPTGRAVVCWTPWEGVMCFVRGPET
jgi:hypothetical protein